VEAWTIVGSLAGVAAVIVAVVFGLLPYVRARRGRSGVAARSVRPSSPGPTHPLGVAIAARSLRNNGTISAAGPGSSVDVVADDVVNTGIIEADQNGPGVALADHLRVIAGHILGDAAQWDARSMGSQAAFAAVYVRYGRGRQAGELYDSAVKAGLRTTVPRAVFESASTPEEARLVAGQLIRWADELNQ
jgi:hypothetical protein